MPGKNWRPLAGKPLVAWTIDIAQKSGLFDAIVVSSDAVEVLDVARDYGVEFIIDRPASLASDHSAKLPAIAHAVEHAESLRDWKFDAIVDLDATSPLRLIEDVNSAVQLFEECRSKNVLSCSPARHSPYFNLVEVDAAGVAHISKSVGAPLVRRQDGPACFDLNGSIYIWQRGIFETDPRIFYDDTRLYVMPEDRSYDIDTELDFQFVEFLMKRRQA